MKQTHLRTIEPGETYRRTFQVQREKVNVETREVELTFSSETTEVERYINGDIGIEILDHSPKSVRLKRLKKGGPLLVNHDRDDQVAVVRKVWIGEDRKGHAIVRFSKSRRAEEIFQDVIEEIRQNVSVDYIHHKAPKPSDPVNGIPAWRFVDWEPLEISIVSVPADIDVGIGRSIEIKEDTNMSDETKTARELELERKLAELKNKDDRKAIEEELRKAREEGKREAQLEQQRKDEILEIGQRFNHTELAREFVESNRSVAEFNSEVLKRMNDKPLETPFIGMSENETKQYSILRAINCQFPKSTIDAGLELEASRAVEQKLGKAPQGIFIPAEIEHRQMVPTRRDLNVATPTAGGHTVATELLVGSFIELLRNALKVESMGVRVLADLVGDVDIPRQTGGAIGYWVAEGVDLTESDQAFDQLHLTPNTVGGMTEYTRKLLQQSSIDVEAFVRQDLAKTIATVIDKASLHGPGGTQPLGVENTTGINTVTWATADTPTFEEIVSMETAVDEDNALDGSPAYLTRPALKGKLKTTKVDTGSGQFVWSNNEMNGYKAESSGQVNAGIAFFGNWADVILAMWGALDILVDPYSKSMSGGTRVTAFKDVDVGLRHAASFCVGANPAGP